MKRVGCWSLSLVKSLAPVMFFFFSSRRRHTRLQGDWSSDVCSSDLPADDGTDIGYVEAGFGAGRGGRSDFDDAEFGLEQTLSREVSLREHLTGQLSEIGRASCRGRG